MARFATNAFPEYFVPLIENFVMKAMEVENQLVKMQIWLDQQDASANLNTKFRYTQLVIFTIDLSELSHIHIDEQMTFLKERLELYGIDNATVMVVGAKSDLAKREITDESFHYHIN